MNNKGHSGFTLIELMMVVAIVAVLATIATAYFGDNVQSAKRTDGRSALLNAAATLEKCKAMYGTYNSANCSIQSGTTSTSTEGLYTVSVSAIAASSYTIAATPVAGKSQANDAECTQMTLNQLGIQGGSPATNECW